MPTTADPGAEELLWREEVQSRFSNHVVALTVSTVIAVLALGLAGWLWLDGDDDQVDRGGSRAALLEERIQALEDSQQAMATRNELARVADQQRALTDGLEELRQAAADPQPDVASLQTAVEGVQQNIDQLDDRIAALEAVP